MGGGRAAAPGDGHRQRAPAEARGERRGRSPTGSGGIGGGLSASQRGLGRAVRPPAGRAPCSAPRCRVRDRRTRVHARGSRDAAGRGPHRCPVPSASATRRGGPAAARRRAGAGFGMPRGAVTPLPHGGLARPAGPAPSARPRARSLSRGVSLTSAGRQALPLRGPACAPSPARDAGRPLRRCRPSLPPAPPLRRGGASPPPPPPRLPSPPSPLPVTAAGSSGEVAGAGRGVGRGEAPFRGDGAGGGGGQGGSGEARPRTGTGGGSGDRRREGPPARGRRPRGGGGGAARSGGEVEPAARRRALQIPRGERCPAGNPLRARGPPRGPLAHGAGGRCRPAPGAPPRGPPGTRSGGIGGTAGRPAQRTRAKPR